MSVVGVVQDHWRVFHSSVLGQGGWIPVAHSGGLLWLSLSPGLGFLMLCLGAASRARGRRGTGLWVNLALNHLVLGVSYWALVGLRIHGALMESAGFGGEMVALEVLLLSGLVGVHYYYRQAGRPNATVVEEWEAGMGLTTQGPHDSSSRDAKIPCRFLSSSRCQSPSLPITVPGGGPKRSEGDRPWSGAEGTKAQAPVRFWVRCVCWVYLVLPAVLYLAVRARRGWGAGRGGDAEIPRSFHSRRQDPMANPPVAPEAERMGSSLERSGGGGGADDLRLTPEERGYDVA
ncbi:MAG: hypothetical protein HYT87_12750 [Nitrospirae bacterium]|nr:hypothetical protein [Nitrospirota bacterium]